MTPQMLNKADSKELVARLEHLPEKFRFQMRGYLERVEEEVLREEKYNEYFNPHNMEVLEKSIADLKAGKGIVKTMAELEAMENE